MDQSANRSGGALTRPRNTTSSSARTTTPKRTRHTQRDATSAISSASLATPSQSTQRSSVRRTPKNASIAFYYSKPAGEATDSSSSATIDVTSDEDDSYGSSVSQRPASIRRSQPSPSSRGQKREPNIHPKSPPSKRRLPNMSATFTNTTTPPSTQSTVAPANDAEMIDLTRDSSEEPLPAPPRPRPARQRPLPPPPPLQATRSESFEMVHAPSTSTGNMQKKPVVSSQSSSSFLQDMFKNGVDLPVSIIAHDKAVQKSMDEKLIAWSVQYTLAQGVSCGRWTWNDVLSKLDDLEGDEDKILPKTESIVYGRPCYLDEASAYQIGKQARLEQLAIMENQGAGMVMGNFHGEPGWFGGRIQQLAHLKQLPDDTYKVVLQPLEMVRGNSTRFARYLGSRRILKLSVTDKLLRQEGVQNYIRQIFVVCGRMFVPWVSKEGSLYLVETDQNHERDSCKSLGDHFRKSYASIFEWHNSPTLNQSQPWAKFVTRNVLGLSTSVPGIEFDADDIEYISDEVAEDWDISKGDAPAEKLLTDGCGYMNQAAFTQLTFNLELHAQPTAVQGRIAGNKGLWVMHPNDNKGLKPKIWIRKSQHKINHVKPYERSYRVFDVVSCGNPPSTVSLSSQSIIILSHNGISSEVLKSLMKDGIEREVRPLMADGETSPLAPLKVWDAAARAGSITGQRVARYAAGMGRVLGVARRRFKENNEYDETFNAGDEEPQVYTGRSASSGIPHNLSEVTVEIIQSGYTPAKSAFLHQKIYNLIKMVLTSSTSEYRIPLPEGTSREAFVIPDPHHVLKAGEVFFYSSEPLMDPKTRMIRNIPVGEAVIGRYPIRLPNDIQKVTVVDKHELYHYKDVIVIPVEGSTSFMQLLSGGDFDGDTAFLIWLEEVVDGFINKPLSPPPDKFLEDHFTRGKENVGSFCQRLLDAVDVRAAQKEFFNTLMTGLTNGNVGRYSVMHENALYQHGADHPKAIRLAYQFNTLLDSSKTGYVLRSGILEQDSREFVRRPLCFDPKGIPPKDNSRFVLDVIKAHVQHLADSLLNEYKKCEPKLTTADDPMFQEWAALTDSLRVSHSTLPEDKIVAKKSNVFLLQVKKHVHASWTEWRSATSRDKAAKGSENVQKDRKKRKSPENARDITDKASRMYAASLPDPEDPNEQHQYMHLMLLNRIKAYVAYCEDMRYPDELKPRTSPNDSFAFCVAFTQLCAMQAERSRTGYASSIRALDEMRGIGGAGRKVLDSL
ncbi:hypothetical protein CYLTODRAFT_422415 [Cylindrobasidium torrendii FP15055 ss-10]|uniref:RNA-dependent RNA polymerase n=1 Tax=Cylindrobasidium torrendii FP15055 ss-10 TaxID=1314674 RepID=A0A0D7BBI3_9AGAR|nr:hypothetical protein CYLTODRAFT_422415 [Cylindrobasidium torrendii FP15055 ss-10]